MSVFSSSTLGVRLVLWTLIVAGVAPAIRAEDRFLARLPTRDVGPGRLLVDTVAPGLRHDARRSATRLRRIPEHRSGFVRGHLVPRLSNQFAHVAVPERPAHVDMSPTSQRESDAINAMARRQAERGTRKALKNFILDATPLGRVKDNLEASIKSLFSKRRARRTVAAADTIVGAAGSASHRTSRARDDFDVRLRFSHGRPKVEMLYRSETAALRFTVDSRGAAGLNVTGARHERMRLYAGYDPDERTYDLSYRYSF